MEIEEAQSRLGALKKWQIFMYLMICSSTMFVGSWQMLSIVYIGYIPEHYCNVSDTAMIPREKSDVPGQLGKFKECEVYVDHLSEMDNDTEKCSNGWKYMEMVEKELYPYNGTTIVTQWDLVCDSGHLKDFTQSVLVIGVTVGAMGFSALSDYIGRKPVFLFSQWAMILVGVANAFVPDFYAFLVLRFFTGALQQGIILTGFVLACELFAARYRTFAGIMIQSFWGFASSVLPLFAFLIIDWQYLHMFISLLGIFTIPMFWMVPESVIWLCANDCHHEAEEIIRKAAKMNKTEMPDPILTMPAKRGTKGIRKVIEAFRRIGKAKESAESDQNSTKVYTLMDILKSRMLLMYAVIMSILWMVISMVYYGLSLSTATLAGNRFLNSFLSAVVEIPANTLAFFILQKWGRRYPLIGSHCITGVALILTQFIPLKTANGTSMIWLIIVFNMIGKFGITAAFSIVFLYAPEIFPTTLRNQAMGIASMVGRLGNVMATLTPYFTEYVPWLPGPLFGGLSIASGLLALLLPETHNRPLPQTIEDIKNWSKMPVNQNYVTKDSEQELEALNHVDKQTKVAV